MEQRGLAPILIILLLAAAVGGYLVYSRKINLPQKQIVQTPASEVSPMPTSTEETVMWETYTSKDIYFKYPSNWNISGTEITSSFPKIRIVVIPKNSTLMNECMEKTSEEVKNGITIKKFKRVTTGAMCESFDSNPREIWIILGKESYSPGISYRYSVSENKQAEEIFDQILSTFKFLDQK